MIKKRKKEDGWEFLFLGANIDAVETAEAFGIDEERAVNYHSDSEGTKLNYQVLSDAICDVRMGVPLGSGWKKSIVADFEKRKERDADIPMYPGSKMKKDRKARGKRL